MEGWRHRGMGDGGMIKGWRGGGGNLHLKAPSSSV